MLLYYIYYIIVITIHYLEVGVIKKKKKLIFGVRSFEFFFLYHIKTVTLYRAVTASATVQRPAV